MNMVLSLWAPEAASRSDTLSVAILLTAGCNLLTLAAVCDPIHAAGGRLRLLSPDGAPVTTSCGITLPVQGHAGHLHRARIAVLLGGDQGPTPRLRDDLRFASALGLQICATGSAVALLADAGLLQGRRFALPDGLRAAFSRRHPDLQPDREPFVIDGRLATCPEGPTALDVMLQLISDAIGAEHLRPVLSQCMLSPPLRTSALPRAPHDAPPALRSALHLIAGGLPQPDILVKAEQSMGVSRRQMERLFRSHLNISPARYLQNLRLDAARRLLFRTSIPVDQIANHVGFESAAHFSRLYRRRYNRSPYAEDPLGAGR